MKKIIAIILVMVLVLSLVGCGGASNTATGTATGSESTSTNDSTEAYVVELAFPTLQTIPSDDAVKQVEDEINGYLVSKNITDIKLKINFVSLFDYATTTNMDLASGAKMDLLYTGDLSTATANGYLVDLTDYLDNELKGAKAVIEDWLACGTVGGTVYAIPCYKGQVLSWKYIYDTDLTDGVYDMSTVNSFADLDGLYAALKAAYPNEKFGVYTNQYPLLYGIDKQTSQVGTYFATVGNSTELVNFFETEAFSEACAKAFEHRKLGYVDPEGSTNTLSHDAVVMSGAAKGVIMGHAYSVETVEQMFTMNNSYGGNFGAVEIAESLLTTNTLTYGIAYTSQNVSAAAKMMNLIWTDEFIASALIYGVEGISWEWNEDKTSIRYPDGLTLDTVPYTALYSCGAFGNQFLLYGFDGNTSEDDKVYMKDLIDNAWVTPLFGFTPSSTDVSTQVAAISNVYAQYYDPLTYGDVDPDVYLPEFLQALESAGMGEVMAHYQAQVDAWLAQQ